MSGSQGTVYSLTVDTNDAFGLAYVSGTVRDDDGHPIEGATVELYGVPFDQAVSRPLVYTDAAGLYKIGYLPGPYTVQFNVNTLGNDGQAWTPDANYLGKVYNGGQVLTLAAGSTLTGIDAALTPGGSISGRITDSSGVPLSMALAYVYSSDTARPGYSYTDAAGNYRVDRLKAGNYAVRFRAPGRIPPGD